jgi:hypothetical protein
MSIRLSHSASSRYQECPKSYQLHYIKNYRPTVQSSALLFGSAVDKAGEHYALTKDFHETLKVFNTTWQEQEISGVLTDLRFLLNFTYSNRDLDLDLLKKEDWDILESNYNTEQDFKEDWTIKDELSKAIYNKEQVGYKELEFTDKAIFNYANWLCLKRKGHYMLKEFKKVFDENVEEVLGTQVKIDLEDENGNSVVGFADFVFKWKGQEKPIIFDLKTSGIEYEDDAVKKSPQLGLYVFSLSEKYENTRTAAFLVLNKNISKNKTKKCSVCGNNGTGGRHKTCDVVVDKVRCNGEWDEKIFPMARSQVLIDTVSENFVSNVVENFNEVQKAIKAKVFPRCFQSCVKFNGTVKCAFYDLCHSGVMDNLEVKDAK